MTSIVTTATLFGVDRARSSTAELRLMQAYEALFGGRGSPEDAGLVLVDLAKFTGYYNTSSPDVSGDALRYYEGQRSVMGRILALKTAPDIELEAIRQAVREEQIVDGHTGRSF
jgi:hypothetical protein